MAPRAFFALLVLVAAVAAATTPASTCHACATTGRCADVKYCGVWPTTGACCCKLDAVCPVPMSDGTCKCREAAATPSTLPWFVFLVCFFIGMVRLVSDNPVEAGLSPVATALGYSF
ncbi:hypothetical protein SDRG_11574 [Saprolegnia diclina VS20]|uniref:Uncharacterized protein n=1 Tax=Saprolegnia diclina (strain VS20) TaxID=1156394 RepID=T0PZ18_SAPDV|nr:hypothetical protein SDRG_11574 [Saprolegnia diclina VS20]EQC30814.1 hypothetical protein SDRG_11574 [Saprolegnia diclina VS20]|eukprot:XP_008615838.1 hypothetical protein SDRG_11574 [Saprolegnia diclina VS20]